MTGLREFAPDSRKNLLSPGKVVNRGTLEFGDKFADIEDMGKFSLHTLLFFLLIFAGETLWGLDLPTRKIEDDSSLRMALEASWFRDLPAKVLAMQPELHTLRSGTRIQVRVETAPRNPDEFAIVLAREQNGAFSGWSQGSWVLVRRRDNNPEGSRIRIFLRSDYNVYVQFRPFTDEKCYMDVVVYNAYIIRSLPLAIPFERLYVMPVEEALAAAGPDFPRRYFDPEPGTYRDSRSFIAAVRARLPELRYVDDGAIDENGNYVFINTLKSQNGSGSGGLNCSGFAKWIVDGILRPLTGKRLPVAPLRAPFGNRGSSLTDPWEESRDPFFGLDWCRNLASQALAVLRSPSFGSLDEFEVRNAPFSQVIIRDTRGSFVYHYRGFLPDAGFDIEALQPLLYTLAVDEPGWIYLAAVNDEIGAPVTPDNPRGLPRLRQFYHIAILVPCLTESGDFQVAVFESAAETSLNSFIARYPGQFVNLVRLPVEGVFDP